MMSKFKFATFSFLLLFISLGLNAQIESVSVKAIGLTCSQCSRSVEQALLKVPSVERVDMNLDATESLVYFKENRFPDLKKIAQAPRDAGFSTGAIKVKFDFSKIETEENCFVVKGISFHLIEPGDFPETGIKTYQIIEKGFLPNKEFKNYSPKVLNNLCATHRKFFLVPVEE